MPKLAVKTRLPLDDSDLANLRESGLTDKTIWDNGLRTKDDALEIPYPDLNGNTNCFVRRRPHTPRVIDGKPVKYEQPKGTPSRAYFPVDSLPALRDNESDVCITEGEKKALALAQNRAVAVGIGGIWCGCKKQSDDLIDDLAAINWKGRRVNIVFDYDTKAETRRHADAARRKLAKALRKAGAKEVYNVALPPGPDGSKQGVDDFIVANGVDAFNSLLQEAEPVADAKVAAISTAQGRTDAASAARLIDQHGSDVRWNGAWDKFLVWDGKRWKLDSELIIQALAKQTAKSLWAELSRTAQAGNVDKDTLAAMYGFVRTSNNVNGIQAMVALARSEPGVSIRVDELDADPWLINVQNGTIDLRTGKLCGHRRDDFITKLAPVEFDADAQCPTWRTFLDTIFANNADLIAYMQRLVGYSLTGVTEEHILPFLYGVGANGKSTFSEVLLKLLGIDYSMKAPPDLLMAKRGESHPTERADLYGKRLVACIETEAGRRMAEALVKELTGGDRVRAQRMREDFWEFVPTHHVWLSSNYKPVVTGTDHGIWRRIKLIPFDVVIADADQDKKLPAKLAAELPGILNWAIEGCLDWQRKGMQEPAIVSGSTSDYRTEMDDVGQFIKQFCELRADLMSPATRLYEAFGQVTGSHMTQKQFGSELAKRGFVNARITKGINKAKMGWKGLRLFEDAENEDTVAKVSADFMSKLTVKKGGTK